MTNKQSEEDGTLSDDEINWLLGRAEGGFGIITTAASHVHPSGKS
jgi:2,4-dienoyl-CoA reductase-like NADH-dependent reductase (Old Yellow Enzyme family)